MRTAIFTALKNNFVKCEHSDVSDDSKMNRLAGRIKGEIFNNSTVSTVYSHKSAMKVFE